jgi:hypothetical protein
MQYLLIIAGEEATDLGPGDSGFDEMMAGYNAFSQMVEKKGILSSAARLAPVASATTVRVRDGKTITTDGPFAETKEQFGGFYLLECDDLDQAIELAAQIPGASHGCVEVRPLFG